MAIDTIFEICVIADITYGFVMEKDKRKLLFTRVRKTRLYRGNTQKVIIYIKKFKIKAASGF